MKIALKVVLGIGLIRAVSAPANLQARPVINTEPRTQFQWEGKRFTLSVIATGMAPLRYQWQSNGLPMPGATNRTFSIASSQLSDNGDYRVIVSDGEGDVTSQIATLLIRAWPEPTGPHVPELARLDTDMRTAMLNHALPGGSLAVIKSGRLVFARGYGFADVEHNQRYQPDSLCRSGSLAKTITAATLMKQVENGLVTLDTPVFPLLNLTPPDYAGAKFDPRWTNITVRQLLYHEGGWNRETALNPFGNVGFDPTVWPDTIARELKLTRPVTPEDTVRWMLGKPLQFSPGTGVAYSNIGYEVLGVLIEKLSGSTYETAARQLLANAQITRMQVGGNTRGERKRGEVTYYLHPSQGLNSWYSWFEPRPLNFDLPYAWPPSLYAADGGWLISAIDFARFAAAIDGEALVPDILSKDSVKAMLTPAPFQAPSGENYGLGWDSVNPGTDNWYKSGGDTGNIDFVHHRRNGAIYAYTFNAAADAQVDLENLYKTLDGVRQWPSHDLFPATLAYEAWRGKYFGDKDASISADSADPDGDGFPNLLEYAQGTDPTTASAAVPLTIELLEGRLRISYPRILASEVMRVFESSSDLRSWTSMEFSEEEPWLSSDGTLTGFTHLTTTPASEARFYRMAVRRGVILPGN